MKLTVRWVALGCVFFSILMLHAEARVISEMGNIIQEYAENPDVPTYGLLEDIYKLHRFYGGVLEVDELNALSLYSVRFLYDRESPWVYRADIDYVLSNLRKNVNMDFIAFAPSDFADAKRFIENNMKSGDPLILIGAGSRIIFGCDEDKVFLEKTEHDGVDTLGWKVLEGILEDCVQKGFNPSFLKMTGPGPCSAEEKEKIFSRDVVKRFVKSLIDEFEREHVKISGKDVLCGKKAYLAYIADLEDPSKKWDEQAPDGETIGLAWFGYSVYPQWTSIKGTISYLTEVYDRLDGEAKRVLEKAILKLETALVNWQDWDMVMGLYWNGRDKADERFNTVLSCYDIRQKGASCIKAFLLNYENAVHYLRNFSKFLE